MVLRGSFLLNSVKELTLKTLQVALRRLAAVTLHRACALWVCNLPVLDLHIPEKRTVRVTCR